CGDGGVAPAQWEALVVLHGGGDQLSASLGALGGRGAVGGVLGGGGGGVGGGLPGGGRALPAIAASVRLGGGVRGGLLVVRGVGGGRGDALEAFAELGGAGVALCLLRAEGLHPVRDTGQGFQSLEGVVVGGAFLSTGQFIELGQHF